VTTGQDTGPFSVRDLDGSTWTRSPSLSNATEGSSADAGAWATIPKCSQTSGAHRPAKGERVRSDRAHAELVFDDAGLAQGWCRWGDPDELSRIEHRRVYDEDIPPVPDWRINCFYVAMKHRGRGIARVASTLVQVVVASARRALVRARSSESLRSAEFWVSEAASSNAAWASP
jgi:hypothetical protein